MKKLLYIDCCIRREDSRTRTIGEAFLTELGRRSEYQVERLVLMETEAPYAIEMLHITKRFPGIVANDNITLQLRKGEIHARRRFLL